jgi:hypothetical protein
MARLGEWRMVRLALHDAVELAALPTLDQEPD